MTVELTLAMDACEGLHTLADEVRRLRVPVIDASNRDLDPNQPLVRCARLVASELVTTEATMRKVATILTLLSRLPEPLDAQSKREVTSGDDPRADM